MRLGIIFGALSISPSGGLPKGVTTASASWAACPPIRHSDTPSCSLWPVLLRLLPQLSSAWVALWGHCREDTGSQDCRPEASLFSFCDRARSVRELTVALWTSLCKHLGGCKAALGGDTTLADTHSRSLVRIQGAMLTRVHMREIPEMGRKAAQVVGV